MTTIDWYKRWNDILAIDYPAEIHYLSILNTLLLVIVLTVLVVVIIVKTIKLESRDSQGIIRHNYIGVTTSNVYYVHLSILHIEKRPYILLQICLSFLLIVKFHFKWIPIYCHTNKFECLRREAHPRWM